MWKTQGDSTTRFLVCREGFDNNGRTPPPQEALLGEPLYASINLGYTETKGPFKNRTQVVDIDVDGGSNVLVASRESGYREP